MIPALTPEQRLRVAVAHYCDAVPMHAIASLLGVNVRRVTEAVKGLPIAAQDPKAAAEILLGAGRFEDMP